VGAARSHGPDIVVLILHRPRCGRHGTSLSFRAWIFLQPTSFRQTRCRSYFLLRSIQPFNFVIANLLAWASEYFGLAASIDSTPCFLLLFFIFCFFPLFSRSRSSGSIVVADRPGPPLCQDIQSLQLVKVFALPFFRIPDLEAVNFSFGFDLMMNEEPFSKATSDNWASGLDYYTNSIRYGDRRGKNRGSLSSELRNVPCPR